jgi:chemotaxis response regulator CheB
LARPASLDRVNFQQKESDMYSRERDAGAGFTMGLMAGAVVGAGLADEILPLDRIAAHLVNRIKAGRSAVVAR